MSSTVLRRLMRESKDMAAKPIREFTAYPSEDNMLEWHFTMLGPEDSPYQEGFYHGRVLIPINYPFAPPDVVLLTPNGRFQLDTRICLSISSYHPENWQSTWGIATVLHALREFMKTPGNNGIGAIEYPSDVRSKLAKESVDFVCPHCKVAAKTDKEKLLSAPPSTPVSLPVPAAKTPTPPAPTTEGGAGTAAKETPKDAPAGAAAPPSPFQQPESALSQSGLTTPVTLTDAVAPEPPMAARDRLDSMATAMTPSASYGPSDFTEKHSVEAAAASAAAANGADAGSSGVGAGGPNANPINTSNTTTTTSGTESVKKKSPLVAPLSPSVATAAAAAGPATPMTPMTSSGPAPPPPTPATPAQDGKQTAAGSSSSSPTAELFALGSPQQRAASSSMSQAPQTPQTPQTLLSAGAAAPPPTPIVAPSPSSSAAATAADTTPTDNDTARPCGRSSLLARFAKPSSPASTSVEKSEPSPKQDTEKVEKVQTTSAEEVKKPTVSIAQLRNEVAAAWAAAAREGVKSEDNEKEETDTTLNAVPVAASSPTKVEQSTPDQSTQKGNNQEAETTAAKWGPPVDKTLDDDEEEALTQARAAGEGVEPDVATPAPSPSDNTPNVNAGGDAKATAENATPGQQQAEGAAEEGQQQQQAPQPPAQPERPLFARGAQGELEINLTVRSIDRAILFIVLLLVTLLAKKSVVDVHDPTSMTAQAVSHVSTAVKDVHAVWTGRKWAIDDVEEP